MMCRGEVRRKQIINDYNIKPVAHLKLLNGRIVQSDAGSPITDSYVIFLCIHKINGTKETINCGKPTANEICKLIGKPMPTLFNPLKSNTGSQSNGGTSNNVTKWNPERKELYNATMLLICCWDAKPNTPLFDIKDYLEKNITFPPYLNYIRSINTMLKNQNTTLVKILNNYNIKNNLKAYSFNLLVNRLKNENINQYFI